MLPSKGLNVQLTDIYIANYPKFSHLKGQMLTILKLDLNGILPSGSAEYEVYFSDGGYIHHITLDANGQDNGIDAFTSWVKKVSLNGISFNSIAFVDDTESKAPLSAKPTGLEPKNNDGRKNCYWCGAPTKSSPGLFNSYDICTNPSCKK